MLQILFLQKLNLLLSMVLIKVMQQRTHLIAYQTAFLKTYYKEDFIAATMSTELTNTSKLREFVEELKRLNIKIVRPSINKCFAEFKSIEKKIFYGLGAIKNVGFEAISNIIKEREKNGKFKSLLIS